MQNHSIVSYGQNWQNCVACYWSFWQLDVLTLSKLSRTNSVQDKRKHRTCVSTFELAQILKMSSITYSLNLFPKLGTALHCGKFSRVSPVRLLIHKLYLASNKTFEKASCIAPQTWYVGPLTVRWPLYLLSHLQTVRVQGVSHTIAYRTNASCDCDLSATAELMPVIVCASVLWMQVEAGVFGCFRACYGFADGQSGRVEQCCLSTQHGSILFRP